MLTNVYSRTKTETGKVKKYEDDNNQEYEATKSLQKWKCKENHLKKLKMDSLTEQATAKQFLQESHITIKHINYTCDSILFTDGN